MIIPSSSITHLTTTSHMIKNEPGLFGDNSHINYCKFRIFRDSFILRNLSLIKVKISENKMEANGEITPGPVIY